MKANYDGESIARQHYIDMLVGTPIDGSFIDPPMEGEVFTFSKYKGEPPYVAYFWERWKHYCGTNGENCPKWVPLGPKMPESDTLCLDEGGGMFFAPILIRFRVTEDDKAIWPELQEVEFMTIAEYELSGKVMLRGFTSKGAGAPWIHK